MTMMTLAPSLLATPSPRTRDGRRLLTLLDWFLSKNRGRFDSLTPMEFAQGRLVAGLLVTWAAVAAFFTVYMLLATTWPLSTAVTCLASFVMWSAMLACLRRSGNVRGVARVFCALLVFFIACAGFTSTGAAALMGPWGLIAPLIAMFVLGARSGLAYGAAVFALAIGAGALQIAGAWTPDAESMRRLARPEEHIISGSFVLGTMLLIGGLYESAQRRARDTLESTLHELVAAREQLVRAERMSAAAELAGAVAHEINTPLAVLQANLDTLRARSPAAESAEPGGGGNDAADTSGVIDDALEGVGRIAELVATFERLACPAVAEAPERIAVTALLEECAASESPRLIELEAPSSHETFACRSDLRVAISELLDFLRATNHASSSAERMIHGSVRAEGSRTVVALSRAGGSLSSRERARAFDPALSATGDQTVRLKSGLAVAYQLLTRNGAELSLGDWGDDGTTVVISLPGGGSGSGPVSAIDEHRDIR